MWQKLFAFSLFLLLFIPKDLSNIFCDCVLFLLLFSLFKIFYSYFKSLNKITSREYTAGLTLSTPCRLSPIFMLRK